MKDEQVRELLYQALETEMGGVEIYSTALRCVENDELKEEWKEYLEQTKNHVKVVEHAMKKLGLDPKADTPGRKVVRQHRRFVSTSDGNGVEGRGAWCGSTGCRRGDRFG